MAPVMIREFFRRLLWHITTAATTLFVVLLIGEYFVPGSVLPFIDLVDGAIGIAGLLIITSLISRPSNE